MVTKTANENDADRIGLCSHCRFVRRMKSDRGSLFYMCERSASDPAFPKYPRLPVLKCAGYEPQLTKQDSARK